MAQQSQESVGARDLKAYTLEWRFKEKKPLFLTLPINPQSVSIAEPARSTVQQTLAGEYVEEWGSGIKTFSLEGHTGFSVKQNVLIADDVPEAELDGYQGFLALVEVMRGYMQFAREAVISKTPVVQELILHLWEEDEHWHVVPNGGEALRRSRNSQAPLLFNYNISLLGVRPVKLSTEATALRDRLRGPADAASIFGGLFDGTNLLGALGNLLLGGLGAIAAGIGELTLGLSKIKGLYDSVVKGISKAIGPLISAVNGVAKACRGLMKMVKNIIKDVAKAIRFTRNLVKMFCGLKCLGRHINKFFKGLFGPITQEWALLQQTLKGCC